MITMHILLEYLHRYPAHSFALLHISNAQAFLILHIFAVLDAFFLMLDSAPPPSPGTGEGGGMIWRSASGTTAAWSRNGPAGTALPRSAAPQPGSPLPHFALDGMFSRMFSENCLPVFSVSTAP